MLKYEYQIHAALILLIIYLIGIIRNVTLHIQVKKLYKFYELFYDNYKLFSSKYSSKHLIDKSDYDWLIRNSAKAQKHMGIYGIVSYKMPYSSTVLNNYQFVLNIIPQFINGLIHKNDVQTLDDMLNRYLGVLEEEKKSTLKALLNPFISFSSGVKIILKLPILMLLWIDVIDEDSQTKISKSIFFKIFSGITVIVTFISGLVTILLGKDEIVKLWQALTKK